MRKFVTHLANLALDALFARVVRDFAKRRAHLYVIQIGANDGEMLDPLHKIIKQRKTEALVVEPVPYLYEKLRVTYSENPGVRPVRKVIVPLKSSDFSTFYYFAPVDGLPFSDIYSGWGSLDPVQIEKYTRGNTDFQQMLREESIPCATMDELFELSKFPRIDILHTDVEGMDATLVDNWPFHKSFPAMIIFEHMHVKKEQHEKLLDRLMAMEYACFVHGYDTICLQNESFWSLRLLWKIKQMRPSVLSRPE